MKSYINKVSFLFLSLLVLFSSCETEETLEIVTPDPEFTLVQPGISNIFLNYGLPDNPAFTIVWKDNLTNSSSYDIEMSTDADFTNPIVLGNSSTKSFSMTVANFNDAIVNANVSTFRDVPVYMRVKAGGAVTNSVLLLVTIYPENPPAITAPASGSDYVLTLANADNTAITIEWDDAVLQSSLGIDVTYTVEAAAGGTNFANPVLIGTIDNQTSITATHSDLNSVALGAGLVADTPGMLDIRIKSSSENESGDILERISDPITISVTGYNVFFPNLFFVGDATAPGWNNNNNNTPLFRDPSTPNAYIYTGYFAVGAFKLLEVKGQWQPQWGTNDGTTLAVNPGGGSDPGTFNVATAGYYTYSFTTVGTSGNFTVTSYDASTAKVYGTMGIIGDSTPGGWGADTDMTQSATDPHVWYITGVTLTSAFLKFRADDDWTDNWGYDTDNATEEYGIGLYNSSNNIPVTAGNYDIWFNDLDGNYILIKN